MGLFKDMKDLKKQGEEVARTSGVSTPTSMVGMLRGLPGQVADAKGMVSQAHQIHADLLREQQVAATGTPGRATVVTVTPTTAAVNMQPVVEMTLDVVVGDAGAYQVALRRAVPQVFLAAIQPGAVLAVRVDQADDQFVVFDWSAQ